MVSTLFTMLLLFKSLSRVWLFATPRTVAHRASLPMGFPRQEYWSGLPFPSPEDLPDPGIEPVSPAWQVDSFTWEASPFHCRKPFVTVDSFLCYSQRIIKFCLSCTSYVTRKFTTYFILASGLYLRSEHMRNVYLVTVKHTRFFWCISEFICMKLYFNYWAYPKNSKYEITTMITMQNCWTTHCCYCPIFKPQSSPAQPSRITS